MTTRVPSGQLGMATPFAELLGRSSAELEAEFADYAKLGVNWLRTDIWWWSVQRTASDAYDWSKLDRIVDIAASYGIEIVGLLNGGPPTGFSGYDTAAGQAAFGQFAKAAAAHFGDKIDYWEVLNEPNMHGMSAGTYAKVLEAAYDGIKAVDASDTVITAGLAAIPTTGGGYTGAVDFLAGLYAAGAKGHFDAVGFHPYTYPSLPSDPAAYNGWRIMENGIRAVMTANGDSGLQVWITEIGAPTAGGTVAMSQADQARILFEATQMAQGQSWAGPILWYSYQDRGGDGANKENWFGLVSPTGAHKEAYNAFLAIGTTDDAPIPVFSVPANLTLEGTSADNLLRGGAGDDVISGFGGNDMLYGGAGNDRILGGSGNNRLWGEAGNDTFVFERGMGWDRIVDFQTGDKIDLSLMDADVTRAGIQTFNFIGTNWLARPGDLGFYYDRTNGVTSILGDTNGDRSGDFSIRIDGLRAFTLSDFVLSPGPLPPAPVPEETPSFTGGAFAGTAAAERIIGNAENNVIVGLAGNDVIKGQRGNDRMDGGADADELWGGAGQDILIGGKGRDVLWGGADLDTFRFNEQTSVDVIRDFQSGERIDLSLIDANAVTSGNQAFNFIGSKWLSRPGDLGFYQDTKNGVTHIQANIDNVAGFDFCVTVSGLHTFTTSDLIL